MGLEFNFWFSLFHELCQDAFCSSLHILWAPCFNVATGIVTSLRILANSDQIKLKRIPQLCTMRFSFSVLRLQNTLCRTPSRTFFVPSCVKGHFVWKKKKSEVRTYIILRSDLSSSHLSRCLTGKDWRSVVRKSWWRNMDGQLGGKTGKDFCITRK